MTFGAQCLLKIETWVQWTTNRKWPIGIRMVTWLMTSRDPERSRSWPQYIWAFGAHYLDNGWRYGLGANGVPIGNDYWELNGHVNDDDTWPWMVKNVTMRDPKCQAWYQFVIRFHRPHKRKWKYNNVGSVTMRLFTTSPCPVTKIGNKRANINAKKRSLSHQLTA